ncbi:MAG: thioredoxin domain-containing protein [Chloroflexi bacterium]|nr:thioredoxin domain-containing protein [Chloroflexota bacterium]
MRRLTRSPLALLTIGAVLTAIVALAASVLLSAPSSSGSLVDPAEPAPTDLASANTLGSATAPVTLDVYADFQCPNCRAYAEQVEPRLVNAYVRPGTARIVLHDIAFLGKGSADTDESVQAAVAARCAEDQGRFWSYQEYLFANQGAENTGAFKRSLFDAIADRLNLNRTTFDACLSDPARASEIQTDTSRALASGIHGTPTVLVNGKAVSSWGLSAISQAIDAAAAAPRSPSVTGAAARSPGA